MPATLDSIEAISARIERHCAQHPGAADNVDGVRRWWLAGLTVLLDDLHAALAELVARGVLSRRVLGDGTVVYFSAGGARD